MPLTTSPAVLALWAQVVQEHAGLHYSEADRRVMADKLMLRAEDLGFESLLDYYYFVRYDPAGPEELQAVIETLAVGETYFFREVEPLRTAVSELIKPLVEAGRQVRIWSAACSTGEEPLTMAMLLSAAGLLRSVQLVASDIHRKSLSTAQRGVYGRRSVRDQLPPEAAPWLHRTETGYVVEPELIRTIVWKQINLLDEAQAQSIDESDLVLCRNVLIYFDDATARRVVKNISDRLRPQGTLLVGVSESLLRFGTSLHCEERQRSFFYRKHS